MYAGWEEGEGGRSLSGLSITEEASKGKKLNAEFVGENEDGRCAIGEDVGQPIIHE